MKKVSFLPFAERNCFWGRIYMKPSFADKIFFFLAISLLPGYIIIENGA